jgi:hypothetical protein
MKLNLFLIGFLFTLKGIAQVSFTYTTFQGDVLNLYKYEGNNTLILTNSNTLNLSTMNNWLNATDGAYNFYYDCTNQYPSCYNNITCFNGKSTIARVDATCGAGCGYLGWTGIEVLNTYFDNTYTRILNDNEFDQIIFYEFGRNFWFYDNKLKYQTNDPIVTGYAVFMRFMAIESLGLNAAPFNGTLDFNIFRDEVRNLRVLYMNDANLNWANTLGVGQGVPSSGWGATDLFASFCFYLKENYGGMNWVQNVWKKAELRPVANTTQDAVDNFIIAASEAANVNLSSLFQYWKWTPSPSAIAYLNSTVGISEIKNINPKSIVHPNPVKDVLNFDFELNDIEVYSMEGRLIKTFSNATFINTSDLHKGLYYIDALTSDNEKIHCKIIKE